MPCDRKPLVKKWDKPRYIRRIKHSRYEQTETAVKEHWHNTLRDLENSYKDEKFWETQSDLVRGLVGPSIYKRIKKIFQLPKDTLNYKYPDDSIEPIPSEEYYIKGIDEELRWSPSVSHQLSMQTEVTKKTDDEAEEANISDFESTMSAVGMLKQPKSVIISKTFVTDSRKKTSHRSIASKFHRRQSNRKEDSDESMYDSTGTDDDLIVHPSKKGKYNKHSRNVHHQLLYSNESETDMMHWDSKYKKKGFEVSASDEFNEKAEILTKKICKEYCNWWLSLGNMEFKSEIKRPQDVEDLFQVWFDEHASNGIVLDTKILPCVIPAVAKATDLQEMACPSVLERLIAHDIKAESLPLKKTAFGRCLPHDMKHVPPNNNTLQMWKPYAVPEDLRTMSCVFEDVQHLTSTKAFQQWLQQRPQLRMAPFLRGMDITNKKSLMAMSDLCLPDKNGPVSSGHDLTLPVSQFSIQLKSVLSKLINN